MLLFFHLVFARDSNKALETVFHEASSRGHRKYEFQNHLKATKVFENLTIVEARRARREVARTNLRELVPLCFSLLESRN